MVAFNTPTKTKPKRRAVALAAQIFALPEPWRSRFIDLISEYGDGDLDEPLSQEEVARLFADRKLYHRVRSLLRVWTH
jgi:hypothetical protein